jgi:LPS O-antigen subunit length determinant protein (WzzB/FepE family)
MTENKNDKPKMAGGIFIALGMLIGAIIGIFVVIALIIWWQDSKNSQES